MLGKVARLGLWPALGAVMMLAIPVLAQTVDPEMALFQQGVEHYNKGEYAEAKDTLDEMLSLKPSSQLALRMRRDAELGLFARMVGEGDRELAATAQKVIEMMNQAVRETKREVADPEKLLTDFQSPDMHAYLAARSLIVGHGAYSVPYLLPFMTRQGARNQMIAARTISTLTDIGRVASMPLLEALASEDETVRLRIAATLGQLGDKRAVASLLGICEDPEASEALVEAAKEALSSITGLSVETLGPAVREYEILVRHYIAEEATSVGYVYGTWQAVWSWKPEAENLRDRLSYELVPTYLYYQRQATECALKALKLDPGNAELKSLLVTALCRQLRLTRALARFAESEQIRQDAAARAAQLEKRVPVVCHLFDADLVGKALQEALDLGDEDTSLYLVKVLGTKAGLEAGEGAQALMAALDFPDKDVRYQASVEIVKAFPDGALGNPEKVMQVLSGALNPARTRLIPSLGARAAEEVQIIPQSERAETILLAATTLAAVNPRTTEYPLGIAEPPLIAALTGYGESVSLAAVENLKRFGSTDAIGPLAKLVSGEETSPELKASACHAIAAVVARTSQELPAETVEVLNTALQSEVQAVREAAAEAIGVAGVTEGEILGLVETYASGGE